MLPFALSACARSAQACKARYKKLAKADEEQRRQGEEAQRAAREEEARELLSRGALYSAASSRRPGAKRAGDDTPQCIAAPFLPMSTKKTIEDEFGENVPEACVSCGLRGTLRRTPLDLFRRSPWRFVCRGASFAVAH